MFICCSRCDAVSHARVLRSELEIRLHQGCAVGGGTDSSRFIKQSGAFVVLLTHSLTKDPNAIFEIWDALHRQLPIITVTIPGAYDFSGAAKDLADLPTALKSHVLAPRLFGRSGVHWRKATEPVESTHTTAFQILTDRLPDGTDIASVGKLIHDSLTAIIAISWSPGYGRNHMTSVIDDVLARLQRQSRQTRGRDTMKRRSAICKSGARADSSSCTRGTRATVDTRLTPTHEPHREWSWGERTPSRTASPCTSTRTPTENRPRPEQVSHADLQT